MKKFVIGKDPDEKDYTIFENPNKELKEKIKNFTTSNDTVEMGWPTVKWKIDEWESDEVKCSKDRNIHYFPRKDVEKSLIEQLKVQLNKKFPANKYFTKIFGVVSNLQKYKGELYSLHKINMGSNIGIGFGNEDVNSTDVNFYEGFFEIRFKDTYILKVEKHCGSLCLYFNKDGDFVNRDYNEKLQEYECQDISPQIFMDELESRILALPDMKYAKGKYYTDKFCLYPICTKKDNWDEYTFGIKALSVRYDKVTYQESSGCPIYKIPTKFEIKTSKDLLDEFKEILNPDVLKMLK